jgi:hypothetical protein
MHCKCINVFDLLFQKRHAFVVVDLILLFLTIIYPSQVSGITGRVHIHVDGTGSNPCGVSFMPASLLAAEGLTEQESASLELPPCLLSANNSSKCFRDTSMKLRNICLELSRKVLLHISHSLSRHSICTFLNIKILNLYIKHTTLYAHNRS